MSEHIYFGDAVKALDGDANDGRVGGYLIRFTDAKHKDLDGEYFDAQTYLGPNDGASSDTIFHHGQPLPVKGVVSPLVQKELNALKDHIFGAGTTKRDAKGIWAETVLDMADEYEALVYDMVKQNKLGWSSGAVGHMVKVARDGRIERWPIGEKSFTPQPCEPQNRVLELKSLSGLKLVELIKTEELEPQTIKGMLAQEMADDGPSFCDVYCSFIDLVSDIAEAANANQDILAAPINVQQKVDTLLAELAQMGAPIIVQQINDYVAGDHEWNFYLKGLVAIPDFAQAVAAMTERVSGLQRNHENRTKEGRMLSGANRKKLQGYMDQMTTLMASMNDLMSASEPKPKSANPVELMRLRMQLLQGAA